MIVTQYNNPVEKSGNQQESQFTIKASAQAFKILSDSLYSNKVQAVVRELSCNAFDSHIEKGTTEPFEIHCPNTLEPYFSVKDYGVGISHDFMMDGYATLFHSTKNNSNDTIGGLGIGRMVFMAYSDSCNVTSIYDGVKRSYVVYRSESGFPTVTLMAEEVTALGNSFAVNIPVESSDFRNFEEEIIKFFTLVHVPYKILGTPRKINRPEILLNGTGWSKFKQGISYTPGYSGGYTSVGSYARMGLVNYPLNSNWGASSAETSILSSSVIIDFPIGSLEITPSREALSYSKPTIEKIRERLKEVAEEVRVNLGQKIKDAKNLWDAKLIYYDIQHGEYGSFRDLVNKLDYNGISLSQIPRLPHPVEKVTKQYARQSKNVRLNIQLTTEIVVTPKTKVYLSSGEEKYRRKHLLAALESADTLYVFKNATESDIIKWTGQEGTIISKVEDVPIIIAPRTYTTRSRAETAGKRILLYNHISKKLECCPNLVLDKAQIYVKLENKLVNNGNPENTIDPQIAILTRLKIDVSNLQIYAVRPSALKKVEHWLPFNNFYEITLRTYFNEQLIKQLESVEDVDSSISITVENLTTLLKKHPKLPPIINDLHSKIKDNNKMAEDLSYTLSLAKKQGISIQPQTSIANSFQDFIKQYPMLKLVIGDSYSFQQYGQEIKDYILK